MQEVSVPRKHDVAVVTVFHIENVTEDRVAGKRPDEVTLGLFEPRTIVPPIEQSQ
jgi:hypothetical protein